MTKSATGTADEQTQAGRSVTGDIGFAWMAWIIDPGGDAPAVVQVKQ